MIATVSFPRHRPLEFVYRIRSREISLLRDLHTQSATHHSQLMHRRVQHSKEYRVPAETALRVAIFIHTATLMAPRARWCFSLGGTLLLANFGESLHITTRVSDHNNSTNTKDSPASALRAPVQPLCLFSLATHALSLGQPSALPCAPRSHLEAAVRSDGIHPCNTISLDRMRMHKQPHRTACRA